MIQGYYLFRPTRDYHKETYSYWKLAKCWNSSISLAGDIYSIVKPSHQPYAPKSNRIYPFVLTQSDGTFLHGISQYQIRTRYRIPNQRKKAKFTHYRKSHQKILKHSRSRALRSHYFQQTPYRAYQLVVIVSRFPLYPILSQLITLYGTSLFFSFVRKSTHWERIMTCPTSSPDIVLPRHPFSRCYSNWSEQLWVQAIFYILLECQFIGNLTVCSNQ